MEVEISVQDVKSKTKFFKRMELPTIFPGMGLELNVNNSTIYFVAERVWFSEFSGCMHATTGVRDASIALQTDSESPAHFWSNFSKDPAWEEARMERG